MHHRISLLLIAVDLTTDSTGNGTGLHYIMTQYAGSSRLDNKLDRWWYQMALHYIMEQYTGSSRLYNRLDGGGTGWHSMTLWHSTSVATVLTGGIGVKFGRNNDCTEVSKSFLYRFWTRSKYKLKVLNH